MEGQRHLVVEGPDGSIAIAFNQEIPPPVLLEPPTPLLVRVDVVAVKYTKNVQICFEVSLLISLVNLVTSLRIFDVINFIFITASTIAVHSERPISAVPIVCQMTYLVTITPVIGYMHMWWDLCYVISYTLLCVLSLLTMKKIVAQIPI